MDHHAAMDHSVNNDHKMDHMDHMGGGMSMAMSFHGGYHETILFDCWKISTIGGLIGSMVGCFLMGVLYEGLKFFREFLMRRDYSRLQYGVLEQQGGSGDGASVVSGGGGGDVGEETVSVAVGVTNNRRRQEALKIVTTSIFSRAHCLQTLLHLIQVVLSYFLMLIFMTYNSWLAGAVAGGATVGYFIFGWSKTVVMEVGDHCH